MSVRRAALLAAAGDQDGGVIVNPPTASQWPGHVPGKVYLGTSEIATRTTQNTVQEIGQDLGLEREYYVNFSSAANEDAFIEGAHSRQRIPWLSIKPSQNDATIQADWVSTANGTNDAAWTARADRYQAAGKPIIITYAPQPERNGTTLSHANSYRAAWKRLAGIFASRSNVAFVPIVSDKIWHGDLGLDHFGATDWWLDSAMLEAMDFLGLRTEKNPGGATFADRLPTVLQWLDGQGFPDLMIGLGLTQTYETSNQSAAEWWNVSWNWVELNVNRVGAIAYHNTNADPPPPEEADAPGVPTNFAVVGTPTETAITLGWSPPVSALPVLAYTVRRSGAAAVTVPVTGATSTRPVVVPLAGSTPPSLRQGSASGPRLKFAGVCVWGIDDLVTRAVTVGGKPFWQHQYDNRVQVINSIKSWGANVVRLRILADAYNGQQQGITKATRLAQIKAWRDLTVQAGMYFMPVWWDSLDGPMEDAGWDTSYQNAFQCMTDVREALMIDGADDPNVIFEPWNEPNQVTDAAWQTAMQDTIAHWRSFLGYTGVLVIDTNNWSHRYDDTRMTALEAYDAGIAAMGGVHQLVFAKHDYADERWANDELFTLAEWPSNDGVGGTSPWSFTRHLVLESEYGNYNVDGQSHLGWSSSASTAFANLINTGNTSHPTFVGAIPFVMGPWSDGNALTLADNVTTTAWGTAARNNLLERAVVASTQVGTAPRYTASGLAAGTNYSFTVAAASENGEGPQTAPLAARTAGGTDPTDPTDPPPPTGSVVVYAAGDIGQMEEFAADHGQQLTGPIIANDATKDVVLALGDIAYKDGTYAEFMQNYHPFWGSFKNITRPVPGNHEYNASTSAAGYAQYFGALAKPNGQFYYSYDLGPWHFIALDSDNGTGSAALSWLDQDIASWKQRKAQVPGLIAYYHHARWTSIVRAAGSGGGSSSVQPFIDRLAAAKADIVIGAHDHAYERFAQLNAAGQPVAGGIRHFVVGTGGRGFYYPGPVKAGSQYRLYNEWGVLKLTLTGADYTWRWCPGIGQGGADSGGPTAINPK